MGLGKLTDTCKQIKLNHYFIPYIKIKSKWNNDLKIKPETIKFIKENKVSYREQGSLYKSW